MQDPATLAPGLSGSYLFIWIAASQGVILITAFLTMIFNYLREGRTRKWLEADRLATAVESAKVATEATAAAKALAEKQAETAKALADHTSLTAASLREQAVEKSHRLEVELIRIAAEVAEAKRAADNAFTEANSVNLKISEYNQRLLETRGDLPTPPPQRPA